ncbi:HAD family hydrolase [Bryobacter aggregatus]|uniref:HAD family hydrolase n=1 Tax=Bryobacter aggregatus TaxID=360054 RepID=UPI0004E0FE75|nr:HAD family hydrolase [Bryobacter aggregatus]
MEGPQTLVIDADDTLWENNIYFEQAWDEFYAFLDHSSLSAEETRTIFDEIEIANIKVNGYGAKNFAKNLVTCYRRLVEREIAPEDVGKIIGFADRILHQPIQMLEGVEETLEYLLKRSHDLVLFTKGEAEEQRLKIDRSPVGKYFREFEIVREKDEAAYRELVGRYGWNPATTWMIGNSPKSDINPAIAAGLNAVYVPHERTWVLEQTELLDVGPGWLLQVENFRGLQKIF